mgnify:CR=1 FL=1
MFFFFFFFWNLATIRRSGFVPESERRSTRNVKKRAIYGELFITGKYEHFNLPRLHKWRNLNIRFITAALECFLPSRPRWSLQCSHCFGSSANCELAFAYTASSFVIRLREMFRFSSRCSTLIEKNIFFLRAFNGGGKKGQKVPRLFDNKFRKKK